MGGPERRVATVRRAIPGLASCYPKTQRLPPRVESVTGLF